ncbi:MAG: hypothetical protein ACOYJG_05310 [Prevotella sp.]
MLLYIYIVAVNLCRAFQPPLSTCSERSFAYLCVLTSGTRMVGTWHHNEWHLAPDLLAPVSTPQ